MIEHYLCVFPSGELRWIPLERCVRYDDFYDGELSLLLSDLYPVIGCNCVEQVSSIISGVVFVVDESGRIKDPPQPLNPLASRFYAGTAYGDPIVGPAVFFFMRPSGPLQELDLFPLDPVQEHFVEAVLGKRLPPKPVVEGS